ncbi:MAG: SDR family NAD(P)-dependent oxidoreductase [Pseudomonadales bacterium]
MPAFDGKTAFISAGATGIGLACAQALIDGGAKVVLCARREDTLQEAVAGLGANASYVVCDVADEQSVEQAIAATVERLGGLDYAVNAAGTGVAAPFIDLPTEQFDACIKTNVYGTFYCMRAQAKAMRDGGGGSIVNIGSLAGTVTHPWMSGYCASKAGINMLSKCAADELGELNIRVNVVEPGGVQTPMAEMLFSTEESSNEYLQNMPLNRIGKPTDISALVAFLLSDEASWITGQVIGADGGHNLRRGPHLEKLFKSFGL